MSPSPKKKKKRTLTKPVKEIWDYYNSKLEIIELRDNGARWIKIAQDKGLSESTVRTIYAQKNKC